jgi:hypothetical protein
MNENPFRHVLASSEEDERKSIIIDRGYLV